MRRGMRRRAIAALCVVTLSSTPVYSGQFPLEFECDDFGSQCRQDVPEATPIVSELTVPEGFCDEIATAAVRVELDHSWVGDLRLALEHESSGIFTVLVDRPGAPVPTTYGCPEDGIEATFDQDANLRGDVVCNDTIPAIGDEVRSALYAYALSVVPDDENTFAIDDCPFVRFDGRFVPADPSESMGCPPLFTSDEVVSKACRFRGRWNDQCGDDSLEVDLERLSFNRFIVRILDQPAPYNFQGSISGGLSGELTSFGAIADREIGGSLELSNLGLEALAGRSCAGVWKLHVVDQAAPNSGRLRGWSVLLEGVPPATPTATATSSPTGTATASATSSPTATATATATSSPTSSPTLVPTAPITETQTPPDATATPTEPVDTPTPTGSATVSPTPGVDPPTATATPTGTLPTATETQTGALETPTSPPGDGCAGDCDGSGDVSIAELIRAVNIALGNAELGTCVSADVDGNGEIGINELIRSVRSALEGC